MCFFFKFVGGDSARDTIPVLRALRAENKAALLVYSVEVDDRAAVSTDSNHISGQGNAPHKRFVEEMIRAVDTVADFEDSLGNPANFSRRTCVALKLVRLLNATSCWFKYYNFCSRRYYPTHTL